jgi:hypothetical protein
MPRRNRNAGPRGCDLLEFADGSVQLDLMGAVEVELARRLEAAAWRTEFDTRTTRTQDGSPVVWTARHAFPGIRAGESIPGRRCWLCGAVVANTYVLASQHGLSVDDPACRGWSSCIAAPAVVDRAQARDLVGGDVR